MSYPNQPYAPIPPQGPPPRKMGAGKIVAIVFGSVFAVIIVFAVIGAALSGSSDDTSSQQEPPAAAAPKDTASADDAADEKPADKPDDKPKDKPKAKTYGDGDYVVGEDIPADTYESAGASSDLFDFCSVTTEPKDPNTLPQMKTANKGERIIITLAKSDGTVTVQGCHPLKKR